MARRLRWSEVRRSLPERAGAGYGLYDEAYEKEPGQWVARTGWRIWHSADGDFRAEDDQGTLQWIVQADESSFFGFDSGIPCRSGGNNEEGGWFVEEPLKPALSMLRPCYLDDCFEFRGCLFDVESEVDGVRVLRVTDPNPMYAATMTVDLGFGLVSSMTADLDPRQGEWIRDWVPCADLDPELFRWNGEYRDSRQE